MPKVNLFLKKIKHLSSVCGTEWCIGNSVVKALLEIFSQLTCLDVSVDSFLLLTSLNIKVEATKISAK